MKRKIKLNSRKNIFLFLSILAVVAVSGCIIPGGGGETKVEAPNDVLSFSDSTVIPNPPILTGDTFTTSFQIKNLDDFEDAKNVKLQLYDWGVCEPSSCTPSNGICSEDLKDISPKDVQQKEYQFKSPSSEKIGGMSARCPIRYKLTYDFSGETTTDLNVISGKKFQDMQRAGQTPTFTSTQAKSRGPIKVDFSFGINQPVRTSTIDKTDPAKSNTVKIPMYIRVENKGSGKLVGSTTDTSVSKASFFPLPSFITMAQAADETDKKISISAPWIKYTDLGTLRESETTLVIDVSGLEGNPSRNVYTNVINEDADCDLDYINKKLTESGGPSTFTYFFDDFCYKAKNFQVIIVYYDEKIKSLWEDIFYINCNNADFDNGEYQACEVSDTYPASVKPPSSQGTLAISNPPIVIFTYPTNNANNIVLNSIINVFFSEDVQKGDKFDSISVKQENNDYKISPGFSSLYGNKIFINPTSDIFVAGRTYTVTIPAEAVKDMAGRPLQDDYTFSFTTKAAETVPASGTTPQSQTGGTAAQSSGTSPVSLKITVPKELVSDCAKLDCDGYFSGKMEGDKCVLTLKTDKKIEFVKDKSQVFRCELTSPGETVVTDTKTYSIQSEVKYAYQIDNDFNVAIRPMVFG